MTSTVVIAHPGNEVLADLMAAAMGLTQVPLSTRRFPDGETYLRLGGPVEGANVIFVCSLDRPDDKFLRVAFSCQVARDHGAASVGLIAPYLGYMRQDREFHPGEAVTARIFAKALSPWIDWLVTVDPHLHRIRALGDIYPVRTEVVHAAPAIAGWISDNVRNPVLIGPDEESEQWIADIARRAGAPHVALRKTRLADTDVRIDVPGLQQWRDRTPVIADDIVSTGQSMLETVSGIRGMFAEKPVCIGVHAVFSGDAYSTLRNSGVARVVTCNTIAHDSNGIDISGLVVRKLGAVMNG
jgi:ribose-phosphate pyrophosphokinase